MLGTIFDFLLVVLGFSSIVVIHEFGHFLAARWAGVRVLAFAVGFGPALVSYRKGLGVRAGSSEREYAERLLAGGAGLGAISPTEYRINGLPFGGYVKMLGQEDLDPAAASRASDSYQNCVPWKKMVIISAGVVFNVVAAAVLFIVVFMAGLKTESARIGVVQADSPAATTVATNAGRLGVAEPGLKPGDRVLEVGGREARSFDDVMLVGAMAKRSTAVAMLVEREGVAEPLSFAIVPKVGRLSGMLELGVGPAYSSMVLQSRNGKEAAEIREVFASIGLAGVEPGMRLVRAGTITDVRDASAVVAAARASGGEPFELEFAGDGEANIVKMVAPGAEFQQDLVAGFDGSRVSIEHLLGMVSVMTVGLVEEGSRGFEAGLRTGDVFVRLGAVEYPSVLQGVAEIRSLKGKPIPVVVLRTNEAGVAEEVTLTGVSVNRKGQIGFSVGDASGSRALLAATPPELLTLAGGGAAWGGPGSEVVSVNGTPVANFAEIREVLRAAAVGDRAVIAEVRPPSGGALRTVRWDLTQAHVDHLAGLSWTSPISQGIFEQEKTVLKAGNPAEAVVMGLGETRRVMLQTYVTFARLFEGSIKVSHLKGPVGIAHIGTLIAGKGTVWLLFFLALISINLAVINFLPLPIVDGGQFLLIVYEQIRGRPAPVGFLNAITIGGLAIIGSLFLIVTFNDIRNLFGV